METSVVKVRPIKLIATIFAGVTVLFLIITVSGKEWVEVKYIYNYNFMTMGLWEMCNDATCYTIDDVNWIVACASLVIIALLLSIAGLTFGIIGLCKEVLPCRRTIYMIAGLFMSFVALADFLALIIYPVKFSEYIQRIDDVRRWDFDWTYGFGWASFIFSSASLVFFFLPKHKQDMQSKPF